jgi:Protein of unknown function (DUF3048) N-terminal domain/Protein of unknown function (DUF3048) C-terminal domain
MTASSRPRRIICAAISLTCLLGMAACGGHHKKKAPASTTNPSTPITTPAPKPAPPSGNPLTGARKASANGVVAVKIDDTANGRPQLGIDQADIVYIEQVEGGLTRLVAVYDTTLPTVQSVRSTRANDPELLAEYGPIAYVASGGAKNPLSVLDKSTLRTSINDRGGPGFHRASNRSAPYNLQANLAVVAAKLKSPKAKSIGLTWSASIKNTGSRVARSVNTKVGGTPVGFIWSAKAGGYERVINGSIQHTLDGHIVATPNVIVQFCKSTVYPQDTDVLGNPSQFTHTVGAGKVSVFRNGRRIDGTWSRPKLGSGTRLKDAHGKDIALAPGGAWFVLTATGTRLN